MEVGADTEGIVVSLLVLPSPAVHGIEDETVLAPIAAHAGVDVQGDAICCQQLDDEAAVSTLRED